VGILEAKPMARILVIDDDPDTRAMLEHILKSAGYEVILVADGREGVERYRTSPAELVITNLYMPKQDGLEIIRELRTRFPEVAIIAMSGRPDSGTMLSIAPNVPAVEILRKPFLTDELLAVVDKALGGQPPARCGAGGGSDRMLRRAKTGQRACRKFLGLLDVLRDRLRRH
jgi:CheY-like chemotaxis protein